MRVPVTSRQECCSIEQGQPYWKPSSQVNVEDASDTLGTLKEKLSCSRCSTTLVIPGPLQRLFCPALLLWFCWYWLICLFCNIFHNDYIPWWLQGMYFCYLGYTFSIWRGKLSFGKQNQCYVYCIRNKIDSIKFGSLVFNLFKGHCKDVRAVGFFLYLVSLSTVLLIHLLNK